MLPPRHRTPEAVSMPENKKEPETGRNASSKTTGHRAAPHTAVRRAPTRHTTRQKGTMRWQHCSNHQMRRTPSEPSANTPPSLNKVPTYSPRAGRCPPRGWQQGCEQPTAHGTVHVVRRCEILVRGGQAGGTGGGARRGHPGAPPDRGRSNTDTQNAGATPRGTRASTADYQEGHSKAGEATRTAGTGNQNGVDGGACAWEAAAIKGMAWPASPVATGCQGNPCSTGIR